MLINGLDFQGIFPGKTHILTGKIDGFPVDVPLNQSIRF